MGVLGKVTGDLEAPRGPDVTMRIVVLAAWLGRDVRVTLPRNLHCAACAGGGCDQCERAGAISLRDRSAQPVSLDVRLPNEIVEDKNVCLRIPQEGGPSPDESLGRGHLLLTVATGPEASAEVELLGPRASLSEAERLQLIKRSVVMAIGLILLFLGMLRLSGWM